VGWGGGGVHLLRVSNDTHTQTLFYVVFMYNICVIKYFYQINCSFVISYRFDVNKLLLLLREDILKLPDLLWD
jgi:hypothetical protein